MVYSAIFIIVQLILFYLCTVKKQFIRAFYIFIQAIRGIPDSLTNVVRSFLNWKRSESERNPGNLNFVKIPNDLTSKLIGNELKN